jgi:hypothetical protein
MLGCMPKHQLILHPASKAPACILCWATHHRLAVGTVASMATDNGYGMYESFVPAVHKLVFFRPLHKKGKTRVAA